MNVRFLLLLHESRWDNSFTEQAVVRCAVDVVVAPSERCRAEARLHLAPSRLDRGSGTASSSKAHAWSAPPLCHMGQPSRSCTQSRSQANAPYGGEQVKLRSLHEELLPGCADICLANAVSCNWASPTSSPGQVGRVPQESLQ